MDIKSFLNFGLQIAAMVPSPVQPYINMALPLVVSAENAFSAGGDKKTWMMDTFADLVNKYHTKLGITKNTSALMDAISKFVDTAIALEKAAAALKEA